MYLAHKSTIGKVSVSRMVVLSMRFNIISLSSMRCRLLSNKCLSLGQSQLHTRRQLARSQWSNLSFQKPYCFWSVRQIDMKRTTCKSSTPDTPHLYHRTRVNIFPNNALLKYLPIDLFHVLSAYKLNLKRAWGYMSWIYTEWLINSLLLGIAMSYSVLYRMEFTCELDVVSI